MEHWEEVMELIEKWQHTKRIPGTSMEEDKDIFIKQLNDDFLLLKRNDVEHIKEIVFKPGIDPPEGVIQ